MFNFLHNETVVKVDFIVRKFDPYHELEFSRRRSIEIDDIKIWTVSPEDLVINKLSWAKETYSETQLNDVRNILNGVKNIDLDYIKTWISNLGLDEIFKRIKP